MSIKNSYKTPFPGQTTINFNSAPTHTELAAFKEAWATNIKATEEYAVENNLELIEQKIDYDPIELPSGEIAEFVPVSYTATYNTTTYKGPTSWAPLEAPTPSYPVPELTEGHKAGELYPDYLKDKAAELTKKLNEPKQATFNKQISFTFDPSAPQGFTWKDNTDLSTYQLFKGTEKVGLPVPHSALAGLASKVEWDGLDKIVPNVEGTHMLGLKDGVVHAIKELEKPSVHFSSQKDDWCTPQSLLDLLSPLGAIRLDPCSNKNGIVPAAYLYDLADGFDGLAQPWDLHGMREVYGPGVMDGYVFVNPPYGKGIGSWTEKASKTFDEHGTEIVMLVPARTDTKWWQAAMKSATGVCFLKGRITFKDAPSSAPFPSALLYFGLRNELFCEALASNGWCIAQ